MKVDDPITNLYFIRHAEPDYSVHDDFSRPLTEQGKKRRKLVTEYLKNTKIDAAFSSPFLRAVETVRPIAEQNNMNIITDVNLCERRISSDWIEDFQQFSEKQWKDFNFSLSGGENLNEVQARNISAVTRILENYRGKTVVIETHGTSLSTILNF